MRIVFDTNVLLGGILARGVCEAVLDACLSNPLHTIIASDYILDEFADRAIVKFRVPAPQAHEAARILRSQIVIVEPISVPKGTCRDPDDLPILGTLIAANADCLVTGDRDLLDLTAFNSIPIITPRALYDLLQGK